MFDLYDYQTRAVQSAIDSLLESPIVVLPTGGGKTVIACEIMRLLPGPGIFTAHRQELIFQARDRLQSHGIDAGIIMAGTRPTDARIQVASKDTLRNRKMPPCEWIIIDECHHAVSKSYQFAIDRPRIGLTATPFRLDGRGLGEMFGKIIVAAWPDELMSAGRLISPRIYGPKSAIDLSGVKTIAGDFHQGQLGATMGKSKLVGDIVEHWLSIAPNRKTLAFAVDIQHSLKIRDEFRSAGIKAEHVDGGTDADERARLFRAVASGEISVLSNCQIATEGVDIPALECLIIARPTKSVALHLQIFGRGLRTFPGKTDCIVLDHAGNTARLGVFPWSRLPYSLDGIERDVGAVELGPKQCKQCYALCDRFAAFCPECGAPFESKREIKHVAGRLVEITQTGMTDLLAQWEVILRAMPTICTAINAFRKKYDCLPPVDQNTLKEAVYVEALDLAKSRGYKLGWADNQYRHIFDAWPRGDFVAKARESFGLEARRPW